MHEIASPLSLGDVKIKKAGDGFVIFCGGIEARIYHQLNRGRDLYTLSYYEGTKRIRRNYSDPEEAKNEGQSRVLALANGHRRSLTLTDLDRDIYSRALEIIAPWGAPLDTVAKDYAAACEILKGRCSLVEAARYFDQQFDHRLKPKLVSEVVAELIAAKRQDGKSTYYLKDLALRLGRFGETFAVEINTISTADLDDWLRKLDGTPRTRNNYRRLLVTLFNFARKRGYLPKFKPHAALECDQANDRGGDIQIFTPQEIATLLSQAKGDSRLHLALGAFSGIRTEEISRLEWQDIDLEHGFITIGKRKAKTGRRRLVPIQSNLKAWLKPVAKPSGKVIEVLRPEKATGKLAGKLGIAWKRNGLRHSFCSYRIAQTQNVYQTSLEAGNSPQIIETNYKELVRPDQAKMWFSVEPKNVARIASKGG